MVQRINEPRPVHRVVRRQWRGELSYAGLRHFLESLGEAVFEELLGLLADLLHQAGLLPEHST